MECQPFSAQNCSVFVVRSKTYFDQEAKACTELTHHAPTQCKLAISCDLTARYKRGRIQIERPFGHLRPRAPRAA